MYSEFFKGDCFQRESEDLDLIAIIKKSLKALCRPIGTGSGTIFKNYFVRPSPTRESELPMQFGLRKAVSPVGSTWTTMVELISEALETKTL